MFRTIGEKYQAVKTSVTSINRRDVKAAAKTTITAAGFVGVGLVLEKQFGVGTKIVDAASSLTGKIADKFGNHTPA